MAMEKSIFSYNGYCNQRIKVSEEYETEYNTGGLDMKLIVPIMLIGFMGVFTNYIWTIFWEFTQNDILWYSNGFKEISAFINTAAFGFVIFDRKIMFKPTDNDAFKWFAVVIAILLFVTGPFAVFVAYANGYFVEGLNVLVPLTTFVVAALFPWSITRSNVKPNDRKREYYNFTYAEQE